MAGAPLANTRDGGCGDREGGDGAEGKSRARRVVTGARERAQRLGLLGGVVGVDGRLLLLAALFLAALLLIVALALAALTGV